ncbi:helix-turn-helix domain-containing protein [Actinomadura latina]|uniref:Helix-turn-helix domain-containing protein n=1 Tax=Actinomadura latina TaxID=163603 RepID=A0A846ZCA8_9ACTN|nr:helix-turn-helix transcriptional regulator [Actinomadura latina]NKZ08832.1 helix-turn-helix domain-containing protein [Actinomadura latina]
MVSPYVRRQRLAAELRKLREERGMMADELAKRIHYSRMKISRLENAHGRPDVGDVVKILDTLEIPDAQTLEIIRLANQAATKGWWDRYGDTMGPRQRLYADIEAGAGTIREFNLSSIPGILQTPELTNALTELAKNDGPLDFRPDRMAQARLQRLETILRPDGPTYEFIIDEIVTRRLNVAPSIMSAQLCHLVEKVAAEPRLTVRVLPVDAYLAEALLPKVTFSLYTFPEQSDPPLAVVETLTTDLVHTDPREVKRYRKRYEYLAQAALAPQDSLAILTEAASRLADKVGPPYGG